MEDKKPLNEGYQPALRKVVQDGYQPLNDIMKKGYQPQSTQTQSIQTFDPEAVTIDLSSPPSGGSNVQSPQTSNKNK